MVECAGAYALCTSSAFGDASSSAVNFESPLTNQNQKSFKSSRYSF
jgi:hypothetical protein